MNWTDGSIYKGDWVNGVQHGRGVMKFADGTVKNGLFENNVFIEEVIEEAANEESSMMVDSRDPDYEQKRDALNYASGAPPEMEEEEEANEEEKHLPKIKRVKKRDRNKNTMERNTSSSYLRKLAQSQLSDHEFTPVSSTKKKRKASQSAVKETVMVDKRYMSSRPLYSSKLSEKMSARSPRSLAPLPHIKAKRTFSDKGTRSALTSVGKYEKQFKSLDRVVSMIRAKRDAEQKRPWIPSGPVEHHDTSR